MSNPETRSQQDGNEEKKEKLDASRAKAPAVAETGGDLRAGALVGAIPLPGMLPEYSGWDVYNNEARKVDMELVKDWGSNLNSLLLFAAIFAAVLTAFIIESKKMLEEDPSSVMKDVLILLANNLANGTHVSYDITPFEVPSSAVTINSLFFASLSISVAAALASVVSLQWVGDYDAAITRGGSSPEDRAKRRQFRHAGVVWWRMGEIIAAIPLLLYTSVALFFTGLFLWMTMLHQIVGAVVAGGGAIAALFYVGTTLLSVAFVSAPFRTPLSHWIYTSLYLPFSIGYWLGPLIGLSSPIVTWLEEHHQKGTRANKREDREVERTPGLAMSALVWLSNELSVSHDSYQRLLLLVSELPKQTWDTISSLEFLNGSWALIFDLLGKEHLTADPETDIGAQERAVLPILAKCYRIENIRSLVTPSPPTYIEDPTLAEYWSQFCDLKNAQKPPHTLSSLNALFLYFRDLSLPSDFPGTEIESTIRLSRWRNVSVKTHELWNQILDEGVASCASFDRAVATLGQYLIADHWYLWENGERRNAYAAILARIVWILIKDEGEISPTSLIFLRRGFESLLIKEPTDVDTTSCLSNPYIYRRAFDQSPQNLPTVHGALSILLARQLISSSGGERVRRLREILILLWARPGNYFDDDTIVRRNGMEEFFEANKSQIMLWIEDADEAPHIHEVFHELATLQAKYPEIDPLWRVVTPQECGDPHLIEALRAFSYLIRGGVTPVQHSTLIHLLCQDLELGPPAAFAGYFTHRRIQKLGWVGITDPCIHLLVKSVGGSVAQASYLPFIEIPETRKDSYARIATHLMKQYADTTSSFISEMQASLWSVFSDREEYYRRTLREPEVLAHLRCIFEHTVPCSEHHDHAGHLLFHILDRRLVRDRDFPTDMNTFTTIPMKWLSLNVLLTLLIVPDEQEVLSEILAGSHHEQSMLQILHMTRAVRASQLALLWTLCDLFGDLIRQGVVMYPEEVAAMAVCINKVLDLPSDQRVSLVRPPVEVLLQVKNKMLEAARRTPEERKVASAEADMALGRLGTHLATMQIYGARNCRLLSCARTSEAFTPAIGWMRAHLD